MEKLLQLLNEYDKDSMRTEKSVYAHETGVISKKFGFIQWLDERNKIEFNRARDKSDFPLLYAGGGGFYSDAEIIIATLSIEDDPIEFLISILK